MHPAESAELDESPELPLWSECHSSGDNPVVMCQLNCLVKSQQIGFASRIAVVGWICMETRRRVSVYLGLLLMFPVGSLGRLRDM